MPIMCICPAGEVVVRQGWPAQHMWFIRSGYVDLIMDRLVVDTLRDNDFFGEDALLRLPLPAVLARVSNSIQAACLRSWPLHAVDPWHVCSNLAL